MSLFIRSASLSNYLEVAHALGLNGLQLLKKEGIDYYALLDPSARIPVDALIRILETSAKRAKVDDFGLRLAETRQLADLGPLAIALRGESTLGRAIGALTRYTRLHNEAVSLHVESTGNLAILRQVFQTEHPRPARQATELMVGALHRILTLLLGSQWRPMSVCFMHAAPASTATHQRLFGSSFRFSQEFNGIVCREVDMELRLPQYDVLAAQLSFQYLDSLLAQGEPDMAAKVRQLTQTFLPLGVCSVERIAQQLGVDRRTVHQRLSAQGLNYTQILNEVRREWVERYSDNRDRPLSELAEILGFSSLSAFSRWHKDQYGSSMSRKRSESEESAPFASSDSGRP